MDLQCVLELAELPRYPAKREEFQFLTYGKNKEALLIILQGLNRYIQEDVIRHVLMEFSPAERAKTRVSSLTVDEIAHDFLRRINPMTKTQVEVPIFNRCRDEEVMVSRRDGPEFERMRVTEAAFLGASVFSLGLKEEFLKLRMFRWIRTQNRPENSKMDKEFTGPYPRYSGAISAVTGGAPEDINEMPACLNATQQCTKYHDSNQWEIILIRGC